MPVPFLFFIFDKSVLKRKKLGERLLITKKEKKKKQKPKNLYSWTMPTQLEVVRG